MAIHVSLYEAKTRLSRLVDKAAATEEIVISKNGTPYAKLVPINVHIAPDFDAPDEATLHAFNGIAILWAN